MQSEFRISLAITVSLLVHGFALAYIYVANIGYSHMVSHPPLRIKLVQQKQRIDSQPVPLPPDKAISKQKVIEKEKSKPSVKPKIIPANKTRLTKEQPPKPVQHKITPPKPTPTDKHVVEDKMADNLNQQAIASDNPASNPANINSAKQIKHSTIPAYRNNPKPVYPIAAKRRGMHGVVILEVTVSPTGDTAQVQIKKSSGFVLLDKAASKAVTEWKFIPASENGEDVESLVEIPIRFELTQDS